MTLEPKVKVTYTYFFVMDCNANSSYIYCWEDVHIWKNECRWYVDDNGATVSDCQYDLGVRGQGHIYLNLFVMDFNANSSYIYCWENVHMNAYSVQMQILSCVMRWCEQ